jgi:hypothetical protein
MRRSFQRDSRPAPIAIKHPRRSHRRVRRNVPSERGRGPAGSRINRRETDHEESSHPHRRR